MTAEPPAVDGPSATADSSAAPPAVAPPAATSTLPGARWPWLWVGAVVAVLAGSIAWVALEKGPEDVVEEFFEAIIDKDVDHALSLVTRIGYGVPYGEHAAFIHPDAIADDWELLSVESSTYGRYPSDDWVAVEVGNGDQTAKGHIQVEEHDGEWLISDPFVTVTIESSPFDYLQVNQRTLTLDELHAQNVGGLLSNRYELLPGLYRFFGDAPGTVTEPEPATFLFHNENSSYYEGDVQLAVESIEVTEAARETAQQSFNALLDDCVTFQVRRPPHCPFGIEEFHSEERDGDRLWAEDIGELRWSILEYPTLSLVDPGASAREIGMNVEVDQTGVIELTGTAEVDYEPVTFTAVCDIAVEILRAAPTADGSVEVYPLHVTGGLLSFPVSAGDTCRFTETTPIGADDER